jgi:heme-degrading monooxygenase HmoA
MIIELASFDITPGHEADFESAFARSSDVFSAAHGCLGATLSRAIEQPLRYVIQVRWSTLEDHSIRFREDGHLDRWRELVNHHLSGPPTMLHYTPLSAIDGPGA